MSGIAETLFTAAHEQYQAALRWRALAFVLLAFLHLFIVKPYVELGRAKEHAEAELAAGRAMVGEAAGLVRRLEAERKTAAERVAARTAAVREALVCRFEALNNAVRVARGEAPPPMPVTALPPPTAQMNLAAPQAQMNIAAPQVQTGGVATSPIQMPLAAIGTVCGAEPLPPFDAEQLEIVRRAQSADDLAHGLRAYIERYVVLPPLHAFNRDWRERDAPPLVAAAAEIRAALAAAAARPGGDAAERAEIWRALEKAPGEVEAALRAISIPESAAAGDWWRTTSGKLARMELVGAEAGSGIAAALAPVHAAEQRLAAAVAAHDEALKKIEAALKEKADELETLRDNVAGSLSPVKWFAVKLDDVAPQFTLLLGFLLAGAVGWPAARLAALAAIARADLHDAGSSARFWLATRRYRQSPLAPGALSLLLAAGLVSWIAVAAWQLGGGGALLQAGLAMAAVLAACLYDAQVQRDLARLVAAAPRESATSAHAGR